MFEQLDVIISRVRWASFGAARLSASFVLIYAVEPAARPLLCSHVLLVREKGMDDANTAISFPLARQ